jgi:hypothetical protein
MPTLQEISEAGAMAAERCVKESIAMDYAYMADMHEIENGRPGNRLHSLIGKLYGNAIGALDGNGNHGIGAGINS